MHSESEVRVGVTVKKERKKKGQDSNLYKGHAGTQGAEAGGWRVPGKHERGEPLSHKSKEGLGTCLGGPVAAWCDPA